MVMFNTITYILVLILLISSIILTLKCIKLVENANNFIMDIQKKLNSLNYIFESIEKTSLFILEIPHYINEFSNKLIESIFKRKD